MRKMVSLAVALVTATTGAAGAGSVGANVKQPDNHVHKYCNVAECPITGEHQHGECGVADCPQVEQHKHERKSQHSGNRKNYSQSGNRHSQGGGHHLAGRGHCQ